MGLGSEDSGQSYRPVRQIGWRWHSPYRLYENDQRLLTINTGIAAEQYRRIAFSDICGFSIADSARFATINVLAILAAVIFLIVAAADNLEGFVAPILAGVSLLVLMVNLIKGKSCRCVVSTAYTHVRLRAITREKAAQRFKAFLLERVAAVQGELSPEEAATRLRPPSSGEGQPLAPPAMDGQRESQGGETLEPPDAGIPSRPEAADSLAPTPPVRLGEKVGRSEQWAALLLTLLGLFSFLHLLEPDYPLAITGLFFVISMLISIVALANARRAWLKVSVACHGAVCVLGYILYLYLQFESAMQGEQIFGVGGTADPHDPILIVGLVVNGVWALAVALFGWQQISRAKRGGRD